MVTGANRSSWAGHKNNANMPNAIRLLPPDIQTMTRQQLDKEASAVFSVWEKDNDLMMRFAVYFLRKGYGPRSPHDAMDFIHEFNLSDKANYAKELEHCNYLIAEKIRASATPTKPCGSLAEYEKANPPIPDIVTIVSRCGQMMNQAETQGADTPYELWRAVLSICKFSTGKTPAIIGDLTSGHPDFDIGMAAQKMQDITAPFLCSTFANYDPDICKACMFNGAINSPIALGYVHVPSTKRGAAK